MAFWKIESLSLFGALSNPGEVVQSGNQSEKSGTAYMGLRLWLAIILCLCFQVNCHASTFFTSLAACLGNITSCGSFFFSSLQLGSALPELLQDSAQTRCRSTLVVEEGVTSMTIGTYLCSCGTHAITLFQDIGLLQDVLNQAVGMMLLTVCQSVWPESHVSATQIYRMT